MDLALNNLQWLECHKTKPNKHLTWLTCETELSEIELFLHSTMCKQKTVFKQMTVSKQEILYLCYTELFEIELFFHLIVYQY